MSLLGIVTRSTPPTDVNDPVRIITEVHDSGDYTHVFLVQRIVISAYSNTTVSVDLPFNAMTPDFLRDMADDIEKMIKKHGKLDNGS